MASVYQKLQKHLDNLPIGFPATETGVEIRLLQYFFTEREAQILLHLTIIPQSLKQIYRRVKHLGYSKTHLKYILDGMVEKRTITRTENKRNTKYRADMLVVGLYEYKVDNVDLELSNLMLEYMQAGFRDEFFRKDTELQLRTIPVEKSFTHASPVTTYDNIRDIINQTTDILVGNCICRQSCDLLERPCKKTDLREWCLTFAYDGKPATWHGNKRHLTKDEALEILEKAEKVGLVLQPSNSQKPAFLCLCCGCCCGVLSEAKHLRNPAQYFESNYYSEVDTDLCIGCEVCINRCNMDAIMIINHKAVIDWDRCIGCGLCVSTCPKSAIRLTFKSELDIPPKTTTGLYLRILSKKMPKRKIFGLALRILLGLKLNH
ncbi:MAG: 4Fe-4S binding protein [Candidatus Lokiarchaeota archaeon]|nr:4Fe-4S binding protein [Candidatus Lokiarchaeota archaeon]